MNSHIITTFRYLFPHGLASGGVYITSLCQLLDAIPRQLDVVR